MFDWDKMRPAKSAEELYKEAQERKKDIYEYKFNLKNKGTILGVKINDTKNERLQ